MTADKETISKGESRFRRIFAFVLIALGVIMNKFVLEKILVADGVITSPGKNLVIVIFELLLILTGILLLRKKPLFSFKMAGGPSFAVGIIGLFFTLALLPPVFGRIFAMSPLFANEIRGLWIFCAIMVIISLLLIFKKGKSRNEMAMLFFSALFLIFIELAVRLTVNIVSDRTRDALSGLCNRTYPECSLFTGHPFMQYIYNPKYTVNPKYMMKSDSQAETVAPFNRLGFKGPDYPYEKPPRTIRIACIGGSTTAHGYPKIMEDYIKSVEKPSGDSIAFECMNFGVSGFSTAHSVVNFTLNVVDFEPDYIVLLHGWNDEMIRNCPPELFKNDYSHGFMYFHEPSIPDIFPIRVSVIYRYVKQALTNEPAWAFLQSATVTRNPDRLLADAKIYKWKNLNELRSFKRNYETILDLALDRGIRPVVVTMAHTVNPKQDHYYIYPHIDQCNVLVRQLIAEKYRDNTIFVDADSMITGKHDDYFVDLAHMSINGEKAMAKEIGDSILKDFYGRAAKSERTYKNSK